MKTSATAHVLSRPTLLALTLACACSFRPARFADRPPVTEIADDAPVPMPRRRELDWDWYISDVYLRRALLNALDPKRLSDAADVNALDEVPRSSWYQPLGPDVPLLEPPLADDGPPMPPLSLVPDPPRANSYGVSVLDARGLRYELRRDSHDRPEMRTSAAAIASRLVRAFGLLTPEVHVLYLGPSDFAGWTPQRPKDGVSAAVRGFFDQGPPSIDGRYRVSATRWPIGIDVGSGDPYDTRSDDPNDVVPHRNRRTLRALKVLGAWLAIGRLNPRKTRDAYVGLPGQGHLRHYLVGLEDALGASSVVGPGTRVGLRTDLGGGPGRNLLTFGLWPGSDSSPTQRQLLAVGAFDEKLDPGGFNASPPFAPISHTLAADGYWAAKRIAQITLRDVVAAVHDARILDATARVYLVKTLIKRKQAVLDYWYSQVSPCELVRVASDVLVIRDEGVARAVTQVSETLYAVDVLDDDGNELTETTRIRLSSAEFAVQIPTELMAGRDRLVVRLHTMIRGRRRPRPCLVHIVPSASGLRVIGIRH